MPNRILAACAGLWMVATPLLAGPTGATPQTLTAQSTTAMGITGDVALSDTRIAFANGAAADLDLVDTAAVGAFDFIDGSDVTARIFRVTTDPGPLLRGNTLCAGPPTWLVAYDEPRAAGDVVLMFFQGAPKPAAAASPGLCGTLGYRVDHTAAAQHRPRQKPRH